VVRARPENKNTAAAVIHRAANRVRLHDPRCISGLLINRIYVLIITD